MAEGMGYNDMMRMQSEAVQRVREMQRRAQNAVQRANAQRTGRVQEQPKIKAEEPNAPPIQQSAKSTPLPLDFVTKHPPISTVRSPEPPDIVEEKVEQPTEDERAKGTAPLSGDVDRLLVVALILLLSQEEADQLLLMALGYLIM